jgi:hypothetical protein
LPIVSHGKEYSPSEWRYSNEVQNMANAIRPGTIPSLFRTKNEARINGRKRIG